MNYFLFFDNDDNGYDRAIVRDWHSSLCSNLMETNDHEYISDPEREEKLIKLFAEAGVEVEFIGE